MFRAPFPQGEQWEAALRCRQTGLQDAAQIEGSQIPPTRTESFLRGLKEVAASKIWETATLHSLIMHLGTAQAGAFCKMFAV